MRALRRQLMKLWKYIDMLLIHSPQPWIEVNRTNDRHFEGNPENWRAMEEAVKAGKVRLIGVSNFLQEDVANIVNNGTIKPAVNQIEVHIGHVPTDLMKYCENLGIQIEAYSPLAHGRLLKDCKINEYAKKIWRKSCTIDACLRLATRLYRFT